MLKIGCDLRSLQELMGHSSIEITSIFLHYIPKTAKDYINKLVFNFTKTLPSKILEGEY